MLTRISTKQYTFQNGVTIEPGQLVLIPVQVIHNDPEYFPEPEVYRPERFDPDNKIPACAYLSFGNGPRMCLGNSSHKLLLLRYYIFYFIFYIPHLLS